MTSVETYLDAHRERAIDELAELVRFRSISAGGDHAGDLRACAAWLAAHLERIGLEHVAVLETSGNPVVYGDWLHAPPGAPTALLYGHYDVQPPDPVERWSSPPFEPTIRDGRMYGRGVSDEKAQMFANLKALEARLATAGGLDSNVKVIVEGDEENRAGEHRGRRARPRPAARRRRRRDLRLGASSPATCPSVAIGLRGMAALEVTLRTGAADLHSGVYGGAAPNAGAAPWRRSPPGCTTRPAALRSTASTTACDPSTTTSARRGRGCLRRARLPEGDRRERAGRRGWLSDDRAVVGAPDARRARHLGRLPDAASRRSSRPRRT